MAYQKMEKGQGKAGTFSQSVAFLRKIMMSQEDLRNAVRDKARRAPKKTRANTNFIY